MTFQFITSDIGPDERRLIRSHVMKNKNTGRPRPSRRKEGRAATRMITSPSADVRGNNDNIVKQPGEGLARSILYDRLICNDLAFAEIPRQSVESIELLRECKTANYRSQDGLIIYLLSRALDSW